MPRFNSQISELKADFHQSGENPDPGLNVAPLETDNQESIADEDAPKKVVHGDTEPRLTEVNQTMPVISPAFRSADQMQFNSAAVHGHL